MYQVSDIKTHLHWIRTSASLVSFTALTTVLGPFGTYTTLPAGRRLLFWGLACVVIACLCMVTLYWLHRQFMRLPMFSLVLLTSVLVAWPSAMFVNWLYQLLSDGLTMRISLLTLSLYVFLICVIVMSVRFILVARLEPKRAAGPETSPAPETVDTPATIFTHLPHEFRNSRIVSISMEDHYANIRTTEGEHLKLMRLSDAIAHLGDIAGAQIHRSHWVAKEFVDTLEKVGRKYEMVLTCGARLPVSNTYLEAARNLLEDR